MHAQLGFRLEYGLEGAHALANVVHVHRPTGVGHVDALRAVALHQLGLAGQLLGREHVAHHQKADGVHAEFAGVLNVLFRHIRLAAVSGHPHAAGTGVIGGLEVMHAADARQQQHGQAGVLDDIGRRLDPFQVAVGAEAVVERGALQAVAMGHLDGIDARQVQRAGNGLDLRQRILVANGMAAIAQGHVGDIELLARVACHGASPQPWFIAWAMRSAVASAAEVMMSRLPA